MIGEVVGSYRITSLLSEGGMGAVYRAEHVLLGRIAALKVLHPELCANKEIINRFFNEAKATTAIKHPGIVEIFDFGYMPTGHAFLVMEFLEGMTLSQRIKMRGPIPEGEAAMVIRSVCSALAAAHAKGIVHRDLKPDNIFILPDPESPMGERSKLLDFGIAKLTDIGMASSSTKTGAVMGTPTYMSPEQCKGTGAVDHRADLYSLGCIFFELVTGRPPFDALGVGELIGAHLFMPPRAPSQVMPGISAETEALIMNLLEKEPGRRVQTARDLAQHLTVIAKNTGWAPSGELTDRPSMQFATPARFPTPVPPMSFTPVFQSSPNMTPSFTPIPSVAQKPTTLSSATGQAAVSLPAVAPAPKSKLGVIIGAAAVAVIGVVAFVALRGSGSSSATSTSNASKTSKTAIEPASAPAPAPKAEAAPVVVEPAAPAVAEPVAPPAEPEPAVAAEPEPAVAAEPEPAVAAERVAAEPAPAVAETPTTKPKAAKAKKPETKKPEAKQPEAKKPEAKKPDDERLLVDDL
jgi:serine/threonine protein kinase